jgi:hypothetical protein
MYYKEGGNLNDLTLDLGRVVVSSHIIITRYMFDPIYVSCVSAARGSIQSCLR